MKRGIEDIFREGLGNANSNPSPQTWSRIKYRLWWKEVLTVLSAGQVNPSPSVWTTISMQLWMQGFLRFQATRFNVYYLAALILFSGGVAAVSSGAEPGSAGEVMLSDGFHAPARYPQQQMLAENSAQTFRQSQPAPVPYLQQETPVAFADQPVSESLNDAIPQEVKQDVFLTLSGIPALDFSLTSEIPGASLNSYDSIFDWKGRPVTMETIRWSADVFAGVEKVHLNIVRRTNSDVLTPGKESPVSVGPLCSSGAMVNFGWNNLSLHGGVSVSQVDISAPFNTVRYRTDSILTTWILDGGNYSYDTLWVLNLDSLINGNPVYVAVIDSHFVHTYDTITHNKPVTQKEILQETAQVRVSYVEFPVSIGYSVSSGKFTARTKFSLIPGRLTYSRGNIPNPFSRFGDMEAQNDVFSRWVWSGAASLEMHYQPFARVGFSVEPHYRKSFSNMLSGQMPYTISSSSWGCRLSVRYYFL